MKNITSKTVVIRVFALILALIYGYIGLTFYCMNQLAHGVIVIGGL